MLNRILNSQVDNRDEIAKEINEIITEVNLNTAEIANIRADIASLSKQIRARPTQSWVKKLLAPKVKKKKGSVLMKTLVSLVILAVLLGGICLGQDEWPITYDTVSTPNALVQLLRNRFSNQSGNYFTFGPTTTAPQHSKGRMYYHTTNGLYISDGTTWDAVDTAGGLSLDGAYNLSHAITVDGTAITLTITDSANNKGLIINQNDVTSSPNPNGIQINLASTHTGVALDIDGRSTATDIEGTANTWSVAGTGVGTFLGIITGASNIVMRNSETIDNNDDGEITFSDGSLDTAISWSGTTLQWTTDTSIDTVSWGNLDAHTGLTDITGDAEDFTISHTGSGAGKDLLITQSGAGDNALTLTSGGTASDAIGLVASAGGVAIDGAKSIVLTSAEAQADAIQITTSNGAGGIVLTSALGTISFSDDDISNVGDLAVDDIVADANDNVVISAVKCLVVTISSDNDPATDFNFDNTQNNMTEQGVRVGVIPAYSEIVSVFIRCTETVTGTTTMGIEVGTATGGAQIVASSNCDAANDTMGTAAGESPEIAATNGAINVWISATPGTNWNTPHIAGSWTVCILYADYAAAMTEAG